MTKDIKTPFKNPVIVGEKDNMRKRERERKTLRVFPKTIRGSNNEVREWM